MCDVHPNHSCDNYDLAENLPTPLPLLIKVYSLSYFCLSSGFKLQFPEEDFHFKWKRMFLGMHLTARAVLFVGGIL